MQKEWFHSLISHPAGWLIQFYLCSEDSAKVDFGVNSFKGDLLIFFKQLFFFGSKFDQVFCDSWETSSLVCFIYVLECKFMFPMVVYKWTDVQ